MWARRSTPRAASMHRYRVASEVDKQLLGGAVRLPHGRRDARRRYSPSRPAHPGRDRDLPFAHAQARPAISELLEPSASALSRRARTSPRMAAKGASSANSIADIESLRPASTGRPASIGMGGRLPSDWWPDCVGITGRFALDYAQDAANLPLRGHQCAAHPHRKVVGAQSLGHEACEAKRIAQSQGRRGSKACRHSAPDVDRGHRIQMVVKGDCQSTCIAGQPTSRRSDQRERMSLAGRWRW